MSMTRRKAQKRKCILCQNRGIDSNVDLIDEIIERDYDSESFWDHDIYHHHDSGIVSYKYKCTEGHVWLEEKTKPCPNCNWKVGE